MAGVWCSGQELASDACIPPCSASLLSLTHTLAGGKGQVLRRVEGPIELQAPAQPQLSQAPPLPPRLSVRVGGAALTRHTWSQVSGKDKDVSCTCGACVRHSVTWPSPYMAS